jgi:hypothetical protein
VVRIADFRAGVKVVVKNRGRAVFNLRSLDLNLLTVFEAIYEVDTVSLPWRV